jgi:tRNA dimethylallyltransferase
MVLAERFDGEIVNCDSVQVFRQFDIGTAKTPVAERRGIPHHLIDARDPDEVFTAGDYSRAAREVLAEIASRGRMPVLAGGTGFYLRALVDGLAPGPERDEALRERLAAREGKRAGVLHRYLRRLDPAAAARIHANDTPKNIRAIEIRLTARKPVDEVYSGGRNALEGFRVLKIGLFPDRDQLYAGLEGRLEEMFANGLVEETSAILNRGYAETCKPFEAIGYKQALQFLKGECSYRDALFYARRDTRRYAKRQFTWFRQEPGIVPFGGFGYDPEIVRRVVARVESFLSTDCRDA